MDEQEYQKIINSAYEIPSNVQELRHNVLLLCSEVSRLYYENRDLRNEVKYFKDELRVANREISFLLEERAGEDL